MDHRAVSAINALAGWLLSHRRALWTAATGITLFLASFYIMLVFFIGSNFLGIEAIAPARMMEGSAWKPHVFRQLVPTMTRVVIAATPESIEQSVGSAAYEYFWSHRSLERLATNFQGREGRLPELSQPGQFYVITVMLLISQLFLLGYVYCLWRLAARLFPELWTARLLAPLLGALALPCFLNRFSYTYDFPVLFFSAWLTLLLVEKRLELFTLGVALASFNKETSIFLIGLFALYGYGTLPRRQWLLQLCLQVAIWIAIKAALAWRFAYNNGEFLWTGGWHSHLQFLREGYNGFSALALLVMAAILGYAWREKPRILKCWMALLPIMLIAFAVVGNRGEYRVFFEFFPCFALLSAHSVATLWNVIPAKAGIHNHEQKS